MKTYFQTGPFTISGGSKYYASMLGNFISSLEAHVQFPTTAGDIDSLFGRVIANTMDGTTVFTVRQNGIATPIGFSVIAGAVGHANSAVIPVTMTGDRLISLEIDATASTNDKFMFLSGLQIEFIPA